MAEQAKIEQPIQLLVEGNDQKNFFEAFVSHLEIQGVQIQNFGGVGELGGFLRAFVRAPDFDTISSIGGVDLFLLNSLFLLPISPSSRNGIRHLIFVRGPSRHAGSKRSDRINDGEDILTPFNAPAHAGPFHALVDQDFVGGFDDAGTRSR